MKVTYQANFNALMETAIDNIRNAANPNLQMSQKILDMGWGGAGVWFNTLADFNGALTDAAFMLPAIVNYPAVMEHVSRKKAALDSAINQKERFAPTTPKGEDSFKEYWSDADLDDDALNNQMAYLMDAVYQNILNVPSEKEKTKNVLGDMFNFIFGIYGLYDLRENADVHPLAKMAALGKSIISKTVSYMGVGFAMAGVGGFTSAIEGMAPIGKAFDNASSMITSFAFIGLTIGFILYYLVPFMPFLYFFFAVGKWVKSIFEAMVGIPLWALAHLHIDGDGIPGPSAVNGYFILLEILLRPSFNFIRVYGLNDRLLGACGRLRIYFLFGRRQRRRVQPVRRCRKTNLPGDRFCTERGRRILLHRFVRDPFIYDGNVLF
jgi:conjugal transfer/type IV secretion protein DotA/TraY